MRRTRQGSVWVNAPSSGAVALGIEGTGRFRSSSSSVDRPAVGLRGGIGARIRRRAAVSSRLPLTGFGELPALASFRSSRSIVATFSAWAGSGRSFTPRGVTPRERPAREGSSNLNYRPREAGGLPLQPPCPAGADLGL